MQFGVFKNVLQLQVFQIVRLVDAIAPRRRIVPVMVLGSGLDRRVDVPHDWVRRLRPDRRQVLHHILSGAIPPEATRVRSLGGSARVPPYAG